MEGGENLAAMSADAINAFNEQHREAMRAALLANPALHGLLDLFDMLYGPDADGSAWLYGPPSSPPVFTLQCRRGVRQGCALGTFLFCLTMAPVYDQIRAMVGDAGALFAFSDDAYCISSPVILAAVLKELTPLYRLVGIGWGNGKTEFWLPRGYQVDSLDIPRAATGAPLPAVVEGFTACLGIPRHRQNDQEFIRAALVKVAEKHDTVLNLVKRIAPSAPFAALRLLQVCGVRRFGHIMRGIPPGVVSGFIQERDAKVMEALAVIKQSADDAEDHLTDELNTMMGGLSVPAMRPHCSAQYLGAYYAVAGPLCHRLCSMRSVLARNMAGHLAHFQLVMTIVPWAAHVAWAHEDAGQMIMDFRRAPWKGNLANAIAPVGRVVETAGVRSSTNFDRPERIDLDFLPPLGAAAQKPGGYSRKLSYSISSLVDWGKFMVIFESADSVTRTRLLTHSGHGGVTSLTSDISCVHAASAETVRVTLRRISGSKALGSFALSVDEACPGCGLHSDHEEALERPITRCPLGAVKYSMHRGLAYVVARLLRQAGAAKTDIVFEVSNLRAGDKTRPGDGLPALLGTWTASSD